MLRDRDVRLVAVLWVALGAGAELLVAWLTARWPLVASAQGRVTADAFIFLLRVGVVPFVLVVLLVGFSAVRFRARDDATSSPAADQTRSSRAFTWSWVAVSTLLNVLFIVQPGIAGVRDLWSLDREASAADPLVVEVTAQQWSWHFAYPGYGIADVGELVLPVGQPVKFVIQSKDVIHSFWVPAFGVKMDAIPGETRVQYLTPTELVSTTNDPTARVQCAELCGVGHAFMRAEVRVLTRAAFDSWAMEQTTPMPSGMPMPSGSGMPMPMPSGSGMP